MRQMPTKPARPQAASLGVQLIEPGSIEGGTTVTHVGDAERPACDRLGSPHDATNAVLGHHIPRLVLQPESSITYSSREWEG